MLNTVVEWDGTILVWIQEIIRRPVLNIFGIFYTHLGDAGFLWLFLSLVMLCFKKTRKAGVLAIFAVGVGALFTNVTLKHLFQRDRPWLTVEGLYVLVEELDPNSFPSGHTCAAFAAAGIWFRALPARWMGRVGISLAVLMGFSRLYVGVHFPSDVLAGALIGLLAAWIVWRLYGVYGKRWNHTE